jgi:hypothetical protein
MSDKLKRELENASPYARRRFESEIELYRREYERHMIERLEEERERIMRQMQAPPSSMMQPISPLAGFGGTYEEVKRSPSIDPEKLARLKDAEPYKVAERVPDMFQVITAWRGWQATSKDGQWRLKAVGNSHIWEPRKQLSASCNSKSHPAPNFDCQCGVWAFKELDGLVSALQNYKDIRVLGNVSLWGRVIETENGYRAQYAYPAELWLLDDSLEELGRIYDVPVRRAG